MFEKVWESNGLKCAIRKNHLGAFCGYVEVPEGHPFHEKHYWADGSIENMPVHGGITYSGTMLEKLGCDWCLGFDMCHACDGHYTEQGAWVYERTLEECVEETERLAELIAGIE